MAGVSDALIDYEEYRYKLYDYGDLPVELIAKINRSILTANGPDPVRATKFLTAVQSCIPDGPSAQLFAHFLRRV